MILAIARELSFIVCCLGMGNRKSFPCLRVSVSPHPPIPPSPNPPSFSHSDCFGLGEALGVATVLS